MSWARSGWEKVLDERCAEVVERSKRPGHDNTVTVRFVEPTMPKTRRRKRKVGQS